MMDYTQIEIEVVGRIGKVILNRPDVRNAQSRILLHPSRKCTDIKLAFHCDIHQNTAFLRDEIENNDKRSEVSHH